MFKWLWKKFLTIFGRIKVSKYPMWLSYNPTTFLAKGEQYRKAVQFLKPGYVIARGYNDYLDGYFIPGDYTHSGICTECNSESQQMIHSMSCGVFQEDVVDFLRCDKFIIFKPRKCLKKAIRKAKSLIGQQYDFTFNLDNGAYYCHELIAVCYKDLDIKTVKATFGKEAYTVQSFIDSPDFEVVYEYNPEKKKMF